MTLETDGETIPYERPNDPDALADGVEYEPEGDHELDMGGIRVALADVRR